LLKGRRRFQQRPLNHGGPEGDAYADVGVFTNYKIYTAKVTDCMCANTHLVSSS